MRAGVLVSVLAAGFILLQARPGWAADAPPTIDQAASAMNTVGLMV